MFASIKNYFHTLVNDHSINAGDIGAGGVTLAAAINWLPTATAVLSFIWVFLRVVVLIRDEFIYKYRKGKNLGDE